MKTLHFGGLDIELYEAHGETHDQLFVWIPDDRTLVSADLFYGTFPNLYTIRGSSPRPVNDWIRSLDAMRRLGPEHIVPMHTRPIHGEEDIAQGLTNYRDAIQWVRDEVVRRANRGDSLDEIAETVAMPPHLRGEPGLAELYGQVDWSARGIYTNSLGWFDGNPDRLYPLPSREAARREIKLMGGPDKVLLLADEALRADDPRWAVHLLAKLQDSGVADGEIRKRMDEKLALSYEKLAETIPNTNGRAYLLESALELREGPFQAPRPEVSDDIVSGIPLKTIFTILPTLLDPEKAMDVHESVQFVFPDEKKRFVVTVRKGVAEVVEGEPLPGTPDPVAVFRTDGKTYRKIALRKMKSASALASGKIRVEGSWLKFLKFMGRFNRGV